MNKKLLAVAVAGALALPGVALAQSSVTISGNFKMSFGQIKIDNPSAARVGHTSQTRLTDDSSRIVFNVVEDLGGGLKVIGQFDWRIAPDSGSTTSGPANVHGNNHIGLQSSQWGRIFMGRQDLHYFNTSSDLLAFGDLKAASWALHGSVASGAAIANQTRTPNVIHYTTPNWGGFTAILAYSTNPTGSAFNSEADIGSLVRKGKGWNFQPVLQGKNYQVGYSYWSAKPDGSLADQRSDKLFGWYTWGGVKVGLVWDKSKLRNAAGVETNSRTAWSVPVRYFWGPHAIMGEYTKAKDDTMTAAQDGAKQLSLAYGYSLSKRTTVGFTYSKITNEAGAAYNLFTSAAPSIGSADAGIFAGEDPRILTMTFKHNF